MREEFMSGLLFRHMPGVLKPRPKTDGFRGSCVANAQPLAAARGKARARDGDRPSEVPPRFFCCLHLPIFPSPLRHFHK